MVPIECPKCGRGGSVPPDRLNARLVCKACHTVFHLDNTGRMVLGEPESFDMKTTKSRDEVSGLADFDLAQTWNEIPAAVKYGVPVALLAVVIYLNAGFGGSSAAYTARAESIVKAVTTNNRSKVVSLSTAESAEAAGQWFDVIKGEIDSSQLGNDLTINSQVFSGNPEKEAEITLMVVVAKTGSTDPPLTLTMPMRREGSSWLLDGVRSLDLAQQAAAVNKSSPKKK